MAEPIQDAERDRVDAFCSQVLSASIQSQVIGFGLSVEDLATAAGRPVEEVNQWLTSGIADRLRDAALMMLRSGLTITVTLTQIPDWQPLEGPPGEAETARIDAYINSLLKPDVLQQIADHGVTIDQMADAALISRSYAHQLLEQHLNLIFRDLALLLYASGLSASITVLTI